MEMQLQIWENNENDYMPYVWLWQANYYACHIDYNIKHGTMVTK